MKKVVARVLTILGAMVLAGAAALALSCRNCPVALPRVPEQVEAAAQAFGDGLAQGDLTALSGLIEGTPELDPAPEDPVLALAWEHYARSLSLEFSGDWYATDSGICRDATVTALDIPAALALAGERYPELLTTRVNESVLEDIRGGDGSYDPDFVFGVLAEAMEQVLEETPCTLQRELTLTFVFREGRWLVRPDGDLQDIFSGCMAGKEG